MHFEWQYLLDSRVGNKEMLAIQPFTCECRFACKPEPGTSPGFLRECIRTGKRGCETWFFMYIIYIHIYSM